MKTTHALKATGLVLIAVVLGMLTVQGSYALWNKVANANAGSIQAANFQISLTDSVTSTAMNMTSEAGNAATMSLSTTPLGTVIPGQSAYAGVKLGNESDAGGVFTVRAITSAPVIDNNSGSALAQYLGTKVVAATSLDQCSQPSLYSAATPVTATIDITKGSTGVFCFQTTLAANMPASLTGQSAEVAIPIVVNQL
ncbi:hypothetical protein [Arthrobacter antibioticus]|uniref:hypothetical protein n=1 Tax=Arthrobacter sp. H35-MC1 TaxID=3046203 RepID=UPI0024BAA6C2|nr:hypothetical protein [Arthrobacter sp. H35-MC1]MDJ0317137.1 hypothetical protein [Arthrobacter sp. H35-MC1]